MKAAIKFEFETTVVGWRIWTAGRGAHTFKILMHDEGKFLAKHYDWDCWRPPAVTNLGMFRSLAQAERECRRHLRGCLI